MNLIRLSPMQHLLSLSGAVAIAVTLFAGAAAHAQPRNASSYYSATLAAPAAQSRAVAGGIVWNCVGTDCSASRGTSRPAIVCARMAREFGAVSTFVADGRPLEAADLARCNAAAS